ncbi:hypothetical protein [Burkholderia vietnamiensis]|uniref:hypothetical protein n=1 Tax=Burkholderia vietnamiensis TaxID=60552 RepID=UPI001CF109C6|nr:hypothetical protein [Burkholderia vietnamiensis]MCA8229265.1 hypothetical protein [Burkholderia vietnamiensis]
MATRNEKSPLTRNASGQRCAKRETGASTDTPSDVIGANPKNFSDRGGHADTLTDDKRQALGEALTEYFAALDRDIGIETPDRILSLFDYYDSRNVDDLIDCAIAPTIAAVPVEQPAAAPIDEPCSKHTITFRGDSLTLSGAQLLEALDFIAPDRDRDQLESELTFQRGDGHAGNGMYCWLTEYPEEGAFFVDGSTAIPAEAGPVTADEGAEWIGPHRNGWEALNETRKAVAEVIGADPETWPNHGNAPLAIAAAIALRQPATLAELTAAARDVLAERARQISQENWTPEWDEQYRDHELSCAAGCYAMYTLAYPAGDPPPAWPWAAEWWKPTTHRRNLVKAGGLILAAIERLDRAAARAGDAS